MKNFLNDLSTHREDMQRLESQRSLLSRQISLVRDLEALGSAMSSHPLNTLSQRYAVFKKKRNDVDLIKNILLEKAAESERMSQDFNSYIAEMDSGKIRTVLMEIKSSYGPKATMSEFDSIKEFLENSNQGQTFVQSEQCRKELDTSLLAQRNIVVTALEALVQYFNVINFYPHDHVSNHRFSKYSQWCRSLIDNKSQEFVRQIAIAYHSSFGDAIIREQVPEHIIGFNYHLKTFLAEVSYQRDLTHQQFKQLEQVETFKSFNAIKEEFHNFIQAQMKSSSAVDDTFSACELTKMVKRFLVIETSTSNVSGEHLADLIINDRWFIDEIRIQSSFLTGISDTIFDSQKKNGLFTNSLDCFKAVTESLVTFNGIKNDFQRSVIPQTLKGIITEDKSVLEMITSLSNLQSVLPLAELALKLQEDLHNSIHNPNQKGYTRAADLTEAYNGMLSQYQSIDGESLGKKIFLGLHSMFVEMCKVSKKVLSFDKVLSAIPDDWSKISELQQARNLFISPLRPTICMTLDQIFLVKRIQTMIEFFSYCVQIAWSFKGSGVLVNFDMDFLSRPLKAYISESLRMCILGRGSYSLSVTVCCVLETKQELKVDSNCFSLDHLCFRSTTNPKFCEKFFIALEEQFRKEEATKYYQKLTNRLGEHAKQLSYILSAHHWLHEDFITVQNALPQLPRTSLMLQLQTSIQALSTWHTSIQKTNEELKQCTLVVLQRLKWASGANPMVNELMKSFESASIKKAQDFERDQKYAAFALKNCCSALNYEMMRFKTPKAIISDEEFLNFLHQWENVCIAERNVSHSVNPIEEALAELLDPEGKIERAWINNVTSLIDDMINQVHSDIDANEKSVTAARDSLDLCAHKLRGFIAAHHRISADIRNLLKSILKHDDSDQNKTLKDYLTKYKTFIENVTELHGNVLSKDFTDVMVEKTIEQVDDSLTIINEIYTELFTFEKMLSTSLTEGNQKKMLRNQSENLSIEYPGSPMKKGWYKSSMPAGN